MWQFESSDRLRLILFLLVFKREELYSPFSNFMSFEKKKLLVEHRRNILQFSHNWSLVMFTLKDAMFNFPSKHVRKYSILNVVSIDAHIQVPKESADFNLHHVQLLSWNCCGQASSSY